MAAELRIPLDIPNVEIIETAISPDNRLLVWVESQLETTRCGICGTEIRCTYGHGQEITLRHLPVLGMETYIKIRPRRAQCLACEYAPRTTQTLEWYEPRSPHTKAYDEWLLKQLVNSTIEDVSLREHIGYDAVLGALERRLDGQVDWSDLDDLHTIGIDEIALKKGRKDYVAIVSARQGNDKVRILAVLPDRKKSTVRAFLDELPGALRRTIRHITTDIWDGYLQAVEEFLADHADAEGHSVVDRFHVAQNDRDAFDDLRKQELQRLKRELPPEIYDRDCKGMLWVLRKNHDSLDEDERERLRRLFTHTPALHRAYTLREELTAIFNQSQTVSQAEQRLLAWQKKVHKSAIRCFDGFIQTLTRRWKYILNYFVARVSSGFVEELNNKIKTIKRRCYGIQKTSTLFRRIWLDLEGRERFFLSTP